MKWPIVRHAARHIAPAYFAANCVASRDDRYVPELHVAVRLHCSVQTNALTHEAFSMVYYGRIRASRQKERHDNRCTASHTNSSHIFGQSQTAGFKHVIDAKEGLLLGR